MKLRYLKSILQSRSSLLPSYCIWSLVHESNKSATAYAELIVLRGCLAESAPLLVGPMSSTTPC